MLTRIKKIFLLVMFTAFALVLAGCVGGLKGALNELYVQKEITEDFELPTVRLEGVVTTWSSSNTDVISITGTYAEVSRPSGKDENVTLTVTATEGEKSETKDFVVVVKALEAPTAIEIDTKELKYDKEADKYLLMLGDEAQLGIIVESEEISTEVRWHVSQPNRASISEDGLLKGLGLGKVTITATSTTGVVNGKGVKAEIEVYIVEDTNSGVVLNNNRKAIIEQLPIFVSEDITFPSAPNSQVETIYTDGEGNELYLGQYTFVSGVDREETLKCTLKYNGEETDFDFTIRVVEDEEDNEFLALDYAKAKLDEMFNKYVVDKQLYAEDTVLPTFISEEEALYDVNLKYNVKTDYQPSPIKIATETVEEDEVTKAVYVKPNDDAVATIEVYCTTENNNAIYRFRLTTAGYTKEEKIEYIKQNVLPQANASGAYEIVCSHINLPNGDNTNKFSEINISWASSDEGVITSAGKFANPGLEAETVVTLTATISYPGRVSALFGFEESVSFEYTVKPAANDAQRVSLQLSDYIDQNLLPSIKYFPFGKTDRLDENGQITNVLALPGTIGEIAPEMADYAATAITWTVSEEGLFDENFKLRKQYLRYHEVSLSYSIEVDGNISTNEIVINVGIAELKNTIYVGGNLYQQKGGGVNAGDVLCQLSMFDSPVGDLPAAAKTYGYSYSQGQFNGYTWYVDYVDLETGEKTRYQYFACYNGFITLDDQYSITKDGDAATVITLNSELNTLIGTNYGGNWAQIFYNATDHDVKIPLSPYTGGNTPFKDENGESVKWTAHPWSKANVIDRENAFSIDGHRVGFVTDSNGVVVFGSTVKKASEADSTKLVYSYDTFQTYYDVDEEGKFTVNESGIPVGDGKLTDADFWVTIPAGGYAYSTKTQQNNAEILGKFCMIGDDLHITRFEPWYESPDGSTEGVGSFKHE